MADVCVMAQCGGHEYEGSEPECGLVGVQGGTSPIPGIRHTPSPVGSEPATQDTGAMPVQVSLVLIMEWLIENLENRMDKNNERMGNRMDEMKSDLGVRLEDIKNKLRQ